MSDSETEWERVGRTLIARMTELGLSQAELVRLSGVSDFTVRRIMRGEPGNYRKDRLAKICQAVGWTTDSIDRLLAGRTPQYQDHRGLDELRARLRDQIERGDVPDRTEESAAIGELLQRVDQLELRLDAVEDIAVALFAERLPNGVDIAPARAARIDGADFVLQRDGVPFAVLDVKTSAPTPGDVGRMAITASQVGSFVVAMILTPHHGSPRVDEVARRLNVRIVNISDLHTAVDISPESGISILDLIPSPDPTEVDAAIDANLAEGYLSEEEADSLRAAARSGRAGRRPRSSSHRPKAAPEDPEAP